jgi:fructose-bisphosphate aldolase class I
MTILEKLHQTARELVAPGKGILAIDESTKTCNKRFEKVGIPQTEEMRRAYRELLLTVPGLGEFISGAILYDETLRQSTADGTPFVEVMRASGIIPGIKVDTGLLAFPDSPDEQVTDGLNDLAQRVQEYIRLGARFAKWRAVIHVTDTLPTLGCITVNAHKLARYAQICQEYGLVPIVEPEVLMEGEHTIQRCYEVTSQTWEAVFDELLTHRVDLGGMILKASMVIAADRCRTQSGVEDVAEMTLSCLSAHVPHGVAGVAFLSGGQSDRAATEHLNEINRRAEFAAWPLTFSYGRALQYPAIEIWRGDPARVSEAQRALLERARANAAASLGRYGELTPVLA